MVLIYFLSGLAFEGLGLAAYLQLRRGSDFPLCRLLPWLAAFGFVAGTNSWVDMFLVQETSAEIIKVLEILRMVLQPLSGFTIAHIRLGGFSQS